MRRVGVSVAASAWESASWPSNGEQTPFPDEKTERVRLEINAVILHRLFKMDALCAADFHCLDCESRQRVWRICLMNCVKHFVSPPLG